MTMVMSVTKMCRTPLCCVTLFFIFITLFFTTRTEKKVNEKGNTFEEDRKKNQEAPETR